MHPVASSCFLLFLFFRFSGYLKCPKNSGKIILKISVKEPSGRTKRGQEGHHQEPRRVHGAAPPWAAPGGLLAALWIPPTPPFAYIYPSSGNPWKHNHFLRTPLCFATSAVSRSGLPGEAAPTPCRKEKPPPGDHP